MNSRLRILGVGLAAALLFAAPASAHDDSRRDRRHGEHHWQHRRDGHRHHARHGHHRRHYDARRHYGYRRKHHGVSFRNRYGQRVTVHGSFYCARCNHSFRRKAAFWDHLVLHHRLRRHNLWEALTRTWFGWVYYG